MPFRNDEFLRKARVTLYYDEDGQKLLPYCKVEPFDSVSDYDTNTEFIVPFRLSAGIFDKGEMPFRVVIEKKKDGAFPSNAHKGQAVGTIEIHQYGDV
jgi:hypothetical protein